MSTMKTIRRVFGWVFLGDPRPTFDELLNDKGHWRPTTEAPPVEIPIVVWFQDRTSSEIGLEIATYKTNGQWVSAESGIELAEWVQGWIQLPAFQELRYSLAARTKTNVRRAWLAVAIVSGLLTYFVIGVHITDRLHDLLFLDHTSIQDGVESCTGTGRFMECTTEDGVRAYKSTFWSVLGNSFALVTSALRIGAGYLVFRLLAPRDKPSAR